MLQVLSLFITTRLQGQGHLEIARILRNSIASARQLTDSCALLAVFVFSLLPSFLSSFSYID